MTTNLDLEREYYLSLLPGDLSDLSTPDLERAYYLWALDGGEDLETQLAAIAGFDAEETQVLGHVEGVFGWVTS